MRRALLGLATDLRAALGSRQTDQIAQCAAQPRRLTERKRAGEALRSSGFFVSEADLHGNTASGPTARWFTSPWGVEGGKKKKNKRGRDRERES